MSGFAVVFERGPGPIEAPERVADAAAATVQVMLAALEHRGPDGADALSKPPFALGHRHFWTTPEGEGERQPLADDRAGLWLVFDGRLDNRDELKRALDDPRLEPRASDARLVLAAFSRWGPDCFERLLGPFAAVVCDLRGRVCCARDPLGDRTLHYRLDAERLLVASEERPLLAADGLAPRLDPHRLAHFFAARVPADGSTFFAGVSELRPGHVLVVDRETVTETRYHRLEPPEPIRCRDDREYAERYRHLLELSVGSRLRSKSAVAVMMSGGLDSTSLVACAAGAATPSGGRRLMPASWVFDELEECDERRFMEPVLDRYRLAPIRFAGDECWPLHQPRLYSANPNAPEENAYRDLKKRLYESVAAEGSRVVLNGGSADLLYYGSQRWLADLVREGRLTEASLGARRELARRGLRSVAASLARRSGLAGSRGASAPRPATPSWLTKEARRSLESPDEARWRAWRRPAQARNVFGTRQAHSLSREVFHASRAGVELRHPYRDRRLVDFMLAIPAHQLYRRGRLKHVAREAMKQALPEAIVERRNRTLLTPLFARGLWRREAGRVAEILGHPDAQWPRFVRREWLEDVRRGGGSRPVHGVVLWQCVAFELWRRRHGWELA